MDHPVLCTLFWDVGNNSTLGLYGKRQKSVKPTSKYSPDDLIFPLPLLWAAGPWPEMVTWADLVWSPCRRPVSWDGDLSWPRLVAMPRERRVKFSRVASAEDEEDRGIVFTTPRRPNTDDQGFEVVLPPPPWRRQVSPQRVPGGGGLRRWKNGTGAIIASLLMSEDWWKTLVLMGV